MVRVRYIFSTLTLRHYVTYLLFNIYEGLVLLKLAYTVLILINTGPSNVNELNLKVYNICIVQNQNFCPVSLLTLLNSVLLYGLCKRFFPIFVVTENSTMHWSSKRG